VVKGTEEAITKLLHDAPTEGGALSKEGAIKRKKLLKQKARFVALKARVFDATICQIFAEMLGSVCHTDHDYIEDGHDQTVRFTSNIS
jgi:hypothetical protein